MESQNTLKYLRLVYKLQRMPFSITMWLLGDVMSAITGEDSNERNSHTSPSEALSRLIQLKELYERFRLHILCEVFLEICSDDECVSTEGMRFGVVKRMCSALCKCFDKDILRKIEEIEPQYNIQDFESCDVKVYIDDREFKDYIHDNFDEVMKILDEYSDKCPRGTDLLKDAIYKALNDGLNILGLPFREDIISVVFVKTISLLTSKGFLLKNYLWRALHYHAFDKLMLYGVKRKDGDTSLNGERASSLTIKLRYVKSRAYNTTPVQLLAYLMAYTNTSPRTLILEHLDIDEFLESYRLLAERGDFNRITKIFMKILEALRDVPKNELKLLCEFADKLCSIAIGRYRRDVGTMSLYEFVRRRLRIEIDDDDARDLYNALSALAIFKNLLNGMPIDKLRKFLCLEPCNITYIFDNVIEMLILFSGALNLFFVVPHVCLEVEGVAIDLRDREMDLVILGWIPQLDFSNLSYITFNPSIIFGEFKFVKSLKSEGVERGKEKIRKLNNELCPHLRAQGVHCKAALVIPCSVINRLELAKLDVPYICIEEVINPYLFTYSMIKALYT